MTIFDGNVIRTTVKQLLDGSNVVQNVWHWAYNGATVIDDQVACDDMRDHIESAGYDLTVIDQTTALTFIGYENFNLTLGIPLPFSAPVSALAGLNAGQALPYQNAPLVSFPTLVSRSIGRKYFGGYTEDVTDGKGILLGTPIARLTSAAVVWILTPVIEFGTAQLGNTDPLGLSFIPWTSFTVSSLIRTQRRRVPGVGA